MTISLSLRTEAPGWKVVAYQNNYLLKKKTHLKFEFLGDMPTFL